MFRTFNMGIGIAAVVRKNFSGEAKKHLKKFGIDTYEIGKIIKGKGEVILK